MPRKVRDLIRDLERAGFASRGGKGERQRPASRSMRRAILGNSGSGKSTLARFLATSAGVPVLDLDSIAWEPHKYPSRQDRDAHLEFLPSWVAEYYSREGPVSLGAHRALFDSYEGREVELTRTPRLSPPDPEVSSWLR